MFLVTCIPNKLSFARNAFCSGTTRQSTELQCCCVRSQSVAPAPQPQRNEPSDIEQSWQEIQQSLFDVSATNSSAPVPDVPHSVPAAPDLMDIGNLSDSDLGPLIQNATLLPPQGDQSFNITEQFGKHESHQN